MNSIRINIAQQQLLLIDASANIIASYPVSTARNGVGERNGSLCTPRGRHIVRARIGAACPDNTVFVGRRATGELYSPDLGARFPGRDWILTRILWLSGCEPGFNRLGDVDTMRRYIYVHGSPDSVELGKPGSIGCIRMRNQDIAQLFEQVANGADVYIVEK